MRGVAGSQAVARGETICIGCSGASSSSVGWSSTTVSFRSFRPPKILAKRFLTVFERLSGVGEALGSGSSNGFLAGFDSLEPSNWSLVMVKTVYLVEVLSTVKDRGARGIGSECERKRKGGLGRCSGCRAW